jgi:hypothetical protein
LCLFAFWRGKEKMRWRSVRYDGGHRDNGETVSTIIARLRLSLLDSTRLTVIHLYNPTLLFVFPIGHDSE